MAEWVYKATRTKIEYEDTKRLAIEHNFLCRSAFLRNEPSLPRPALVSAIMPDDIIHFYYRLADGVKSLGSFRVVNGGDSFPDEFSGYVAGTALVGVRETCAVLLHLLEKGHKANPDRGYERDPVLKVFTGWAIEKRDDIKTPDYDHPRLFPGPRWNLWRFPDPRLPR